MEYFNALQRMYDVIAYRYGDCCDTTITDLAEGKEMDEKKSGYHWECKYCDCTRAMPYPDEPDFLVCARCGAEWEDCKIQVPNEEDESIWW